MPITAVLPASLHCVATASSVVNPLWAPGDDPREERHVRADWVQQHFKPGPGERERCGTPERVEWEVK